MNKLIVVADVGGTVNLRQSPSKTAPILTTVKVRTEVELIEKISEDWCKIKYGKHEGYMMTKFLRNSNQSQIKQEDLQEIYNSLKETLALIEKVLK